MRVRGYTEFTTTELPDGLQFRVVRHASLRDWIKWFAKSAILITVLALFLKVADLVLGWKDSVDLIFLACFWFGMFVPPILAYWLNGGVTELRVTSNELVAAGNLGDNIFSKRAIVATSQVESLRWKTGGVLLERDSLWRRPIWVLPGLNLEQGTTVMNSILGRFPDLWEEYLGAGSLSSGYRMALRPLGLSAREDGTPEIKS
jgi:hypothetical protein